LRNTSPPSPLGREVVPQLLAAAVIDPGVGLGSGEAVRHGGEEVEGLGLALEVVLGREVHVGVALGDGVEHLERGHEFAAVVQFEPQLAFAGFVDTLDDPVGGRAQTGEILGKRSHEFQFPNALRKCRAREAGGSGCRGYGPGRHCRF
jgi:hypothetical protein